MRLMIVGIATCAMLTGCIPFINSGKSAAEVPAGYSNEVLTQRAPQEVAACIGQTTKGAVANGSDGKYTITSADADRPTTYVVDVIEDHDYRQTRVLTKGEQLHLNEGVRVVNCASAPIPAGGLP